jgi:hypothetical protein
METKLYIKDDDYITLPLKRPTMQVKDALLKLNLEFANEQKKIMSNDKFKDIKTIQEALINSEKGTNSIETLSIINTPENAVLIEEFTLATQKIIDEFLLKKFKEVINAKSIDDPEVKKQFESSVNSAFWKNQDLGEVNDALNYFRTKLGIG